MAAPWVSVILHHNNRKISLTLLESSYSLPLLLAFSTFVMTTVARARGNLGVDVVFLTCIVLLL
jgi:hypothetical protein